jgi:glutathione synthase/RimK-type ligase-like ATP-grasp enzyme
MILILSSVTDTHAILVQKELQNNSNETKIFDLRKFSNGLLLDYQIGENPIRQFIEGDGSNINFTDITSVWFRRPRYPLISRRALEIEDRRFGNMEWINAIDGMLSLDMKCVNSLQHQQAAIKPKQLEIARNCGLIVPETLITNNSDKVEEFLTKHANRVVHKAMSVPTHRFLDTRLWKEEDRHHLTDLKLAPTIFQEYISGPYDVRATVVGNEIFSARITNPKKSDSDEIDSRLNLDLPYEPYELPEEISDRIFRFMEKMGLVFGTIDLKITSHGEHVFFEINPQGQFLYVEILTKLPIVRALAKYLAE